MSKARGLADLGNVYDDGALSNRNLIINGAMQVAQRGTSAAGKNQNGYYACDRAQVYFSSIDEMVATVSQDSSGPDGFIKSHKVLVTTAETSIESNDLHCMLWYSIEGQDLQQLGYGSSNANPMTLSFWVKSNVTGTYTVSFYASIGGSNKVVTPTYTITAANTWEYKTITISGSTVGALVNSSSTGLELYWNGLVGPDFRSGSAANSWVTYTTNNWAVGHTADFGLDVNDYWQITGVQLEVGDTATPFEHRSYGDELARCQRYYFEWNTDESNFKRIAVGQYTSTTSFQGSLSLPVSMRAAPDVDFNCDVWGGSGYAISALVVQDSIGTFSATTATASSNNLGALRFNAAGEYLKLDAEL